VDVLNFGDLLKPVDMGAYERSAPFGDGAFRFDSPSPSVSVTFCLGLNPASLSASDLVLTNLSTGQLIDSAAAAVASYDATSRTASWSFPALLPDGNYRASLGAGSVNNTFGQSALGADLTFDFFVLAADANRDRKVDINDLAILAANWNGSGKVFSQGDFNYDGRVDAIDLGILSTRWQQVMSAPIAAAQPIALATRTPARSATRVISLIT